MPVPNVGPVGLSWYGTIEKDDIEAAFLLFDYRRMNLLRRTMSSSILAMQIFCFAQDYVGGEDHRTLSIDFYLIPVLLIVCVIGGFTITARSMNQYGRNVATSSGAPDGDVRALLMARAKTICLVHGDMVWGLCIVLNSIIFQARMVSLCTGPTASSVTPCQTYQTGAFPVPPSLHAIAMAAVAAMMGQNYMQSLSTVFVIMAALAGQFAALYPYSRDSPSARVDLAQVTMLHCMVFGCIVVMGMQWPLYRRKQFLAMRALEARLEEVMRMTEQLREADRREKQLLADKVRAGHQQMEERAKLLRYLFHEIRVPLNTVSMGIELLQEDAKGLGHDSAAHLAMMWAASHTAISTLSDALDLSKLERSQSEPPPLKPTRILGLLEDAVSHNKPFAAGNSVHLTYDWQRVGMPEWVLSDHQGLKQVLNNFVTNAVKFCPKDGTGQVKVWAGLSLPAEASAEPLASPKSEDDNGSASGRSADRNIHHSRSTDGTVAAGPDQDDGYCILDQLTPPFLSNLMDQGFEVVPSISSASSSSGSAAGGSSGNMDEDRPAVETAQLYLAVCDNGVGISQEELPKLYSAFQQLDAGIEYKGRGTGLGLAISKGIVGKMQGRVGVRSAEGYGSAFYVSLSLPVVRRVAAIPGRDGVVSASTKGSGAIQANGPTLAIPVSAGDVTDGHTGRRVTTTGRPYRDVPTQVVTVTVTADDSGLALGPDETGSVGAQSVTASTHVSIDVAPSPRSVPGSVGGSDGRTESESDHEHGASAGDQVVTASTVPTTGTAVTEASHSSQLSPHGRPPLHAVRRSGSIDMSQHPRTMFLGTAVGAPGPLQSPPGSIHSPPFHGAEGQALSPLRDARASSRAAEAANVLPFYALSAPGTTASGPHTLAPSATPSTVRVLVVEDVLSNRTMLVKLLDRRWKGLGLAEKHGPLECAEAENGELALQAVAAAPHGHYSAVLMDGNMPVLDGYDATTRLRQDHGYKGLLLGLTGNGLPADVERFRTAGADDVLIKPADVTAVAHTIGQALRARTRAG